MNLIFLRVCLSAKNGSARTGKDQAQLLPCDQTDHERLWRYAFRASGKQIWDVFAKRAVMMLKTTPNGDEICPGREIPFGAPEHAVCVAEQFFAQDVRVVNFQIRY